MTLATVGVGSDPFALLTWLRANILRYRPRRIAARDIIEYQKSEDPPSPEVLSQRIVECSEQILRTLLGDPSEAEIEMVQGCPTVSVPGLVVRGSNQEVPEAQADRRLRCVVMSVACRSGRQALPSSSAA